MYHPMYFDLDSLYFIFVTHIILCEAVGGIGFEVQPK